MLQLHYQQELYREWGHSLPELTAQLPRVLRSAAEMADADERIGLFDAVKTACRHDELLLLLMEEFVFQMCGNFVLTPVEYLSLNHKHIRVLFLLFLAQAISD